MDKKLSKNERIKEEKIRKSEEIIQKIIDEELIKASNINAILLNNIKVRLVRTMEEIVPSPNIYYINTYDDDGNYIRTEEYINIENKLELIGTCDFSEYLTDIDELVSESLNYNIPLLIKVKSFEEISKINELYQNINTVFILNNSDYYIVGRNGDLIEIFPIRIDETDNKINNKQSVEDKNIQKIKEEKIRKCDEMIGRIIAEEFQRDMKTNVELYGNSFIRSVVKSKDEMTINNHHYYMNQYTDDGDYIISDIYCRIGVDEEWFGAGFKIHHVGSIDYREHLKDELESHYMENFMENTPVTPSKKTIVINLFGAPGAGKSTGAAYLFSKFKMSNYKIELITEFAKDKVYEGSVEVFNNQAYIFGKQYFRMSRCESSVDIIITDSPLPLSIYYNKDSILGDSFNDTVMNVFNSYNNLNIFINRVKEYNPNGRFQSEEESDNISTELKELLEELNISYLEINGNIQDYDSVYEILEKLVIENLK